MKKLKPIISKKKFEISLARDLYKFLYDMIFEQLELFFAEKIENETNIIVDALLHGSIYYDNGIFTGKFNNTISSELERLGAKYSRRYHGYKLELSKISPEIQQTIARVKMQARQNVDNALRFLQDIENQKAYIFSKLDLGLHAEELQRDLFGQVQTSLRAVNSIPYENTQYQNEQLQQNYIENLTRSITGYADREIVRLRNDLSVMIREGATPRDLKEYLMEHEGMSKRRASLIARNENMLFVSQYQENKMREAGVNKYMWQTNLDGRERPLHRELDGQIFSYDNPPIIDERTGQRGHCGQTYGCRCVCVPVVLDEDVAFLQSLRK